MTSASYQLPFVNPPAGADPFASRAVWDTGSEPARATAFSISPPETPPPTDSPVKLCGDSRRGSGLPFKLILRFPTKGNSFVRAAAERVGPSVVRINTERNQPSEAGGKDLFSKFFGGDDLALEDRAKDREQGQGSGFVVDGRQGIIVTNAHVINRADTVLVTFTDGRTFRGVVVGTDELTDLAVIKVELPQWESLPNAPLGDSNSLEVGDWVIAVGNPFGLDNTVTLGIVSCLHRQAAEIGIPEKRVDFLQTDCAINPGNSGGPLLNEFGKVVGINTAIRADAEGISFAIPINYARKIVDVLSQGLPMRHAYIGVQVVTITPGLARQHNTEPGSRGVLPEVGGLLVANIADGSPAEAAGLRSGDVILEMDGRRLRSAGELQCVIAYSDVGQLIKVKTRRGQETIVLNIVAGDLTPLLSAKSGGSPRPK
ncbi:Trypsin family protein with PDZ domain [Klebsormidium nitens]|uniref:Trypsin family protein with PDZ domain n=1 Tax=Klebsormidium nitens TaxID=105231 RepID=A0A1Y1HNL7_KLENI|nr:Trypsin family protein with PDZ domain [Klebsormidium nitens]|eukprot:GAQ78206.1 Trypsin family protein with PDZ domain [Klebsormidium nitens]